MNVTIIKRSIILLLVLGFTTVVFGQNTLSLMNDLPQAMGTNPAIQHSAKVYVGFPGLSSFNINILNKGFAYSDLIHHGEGAYKDSLIIDIDNLLTKSLDENYLSPDIQIELLSFGFQVKELYFRFAVKNRSFMKMTYPINLLRFVTKGNAHADFLGQTADIGGLRLNLLNYTDISLSGSMKVAEGITVGLGLKYLMGAANINTDKMDLTLNTDAENFSMTFDSDIAMNIALPLDVVLNEEGYAENIEMKDDPDIISDFILSKNTGFAVDLGIVYEMDEKTTFYGSLIDLGKINWKNNVNNLTINNQAIFEGVNFTPLITGEDDEVDFNGIMDEITEDFDVEHDEKAYATWLPATLYLGGTYKVHQIITAGGMLRSVFYDHKMSPALTLSGKVDFMKDCSAMLTYSMMNRRYDNIGIGLNFRFVYLVTDNIIGFFRPQHTNTVSFRFGINLPFGYTKKELPSKASIENSGIE